MMALGYTLTEEALMSKGRYVTRNLDTYLIPTFADARGSIEVLPIETLNEGDEYGPRGIGEIGSIGLAPQLLPLFTMRPANRSPVPIDPLELQERPALIQKAVIGK